MRAGRRGAGPAGRRAAEVNGLTITHAAAALQARPALGGDRTRAAGSDLQGHRPPDFQGKSQETVPTSKPHARGLRARRRQGPEPRSRAALVSFTGRRRGGGGNTNPEGKVFGTTQEGVGFGRETEQPGGRGGAAGDGPTRRPARPPTAEQGPRRGGGKITRRCGLTAGSLPLTPGGAAQPQRGARPSCLWSEAAAWTRDRTASRPCSVWWDGDPGSATPTVIRFTSFLAFSSQTPIFILVTSTCSARPGIPFLSRELKFADLNIRGAV